MCFVFAFRVEVGVRVLFREDVVLELGIQLLEILAGLIGAALDMRLSLRVLDFTAVVRLQIQVYGGRESSLDFGLSLLG